jgi:predicted nucleic acid-binding protein
MSDKIFIDSNILVYCYTNSDLKKQNIARALAAKDSTCISTQVLNETTNVLHRKYGISWDILED